MPKPSRRVAAILIALLVAATVQVITQVATSTAAQAVPGLQRVASTVLENTDQHKGRSVICPNGKRVVGGGAWAFENNGNKVHLTRLEPGRFTLNGTLVDGYSVEAEAEPGFTGSWFLQAWAICADPVPGLEIVSSGPSVASSPPFLPRSVDCPGSKKLLGTGARINNSSGGTLLNGEVGLQRVSGDSLTRSLATAHEDANGDSQSWSLTTYGICANPIAGANVKTSQPSGGAGFVTCDVGTVHSIGGGGPLFDAGSFFLTKLLPASSGFRADVAVTGTPAFIDVQAFCIP